MDMEISRKLWDEIKVRLTGEFMAIITLKRKLSIQQPNFTPYLKKNTLNSKPAEVKKSDERRGK